MWGGGWLARLGVCDFAGGIVIHTSAGVASLVTALRLGPRVGFAGLASHSLAPHNLPMAATGAGLLWVGWFAFNGGSALAVGSLAASALLSTHVAGAGGALVWLALDWGHAGRPTFVGCINGALSGLAGVTPASGYVTPSAGLVVGLVCGAASYGGVLLFKAPIAASLSTQHSCSPLHQLPLHASPLSSLRSISALTMRSTSPRSTA